MSTTEFPESFTLELRARHFHETKFCEGRCAIEKAIDEVYPKWKASECLDSILIYETASPIEYDHEDYYTTRFVADQELAASRNFDDTIIRTIKMTRA